MINTWQCVRCGFKIRGRIVYPLHCRCGTVIVDNGGLLLEKIVQKKFITLQQRLRDTFSFIAKIPEDITAVAGIPRSGMFSASLIAEALHISLYTISNELIPLASGWRHQDRLDNGRLLIIDDTVATGRSMRCLPRIIRKHIRAAIYVNPEKIELVDLYQSLLPLPHYLEWNIFNSIHSKNLATDFDGVLCEDPTLKCNTCGYERWLQNAPIKQRPVKYPIKLIATSRQRQYKRHTELWLDKYKITYDKLVMEANKAEVYYNSPANIFVESDKNQAEQIANDTQKCVICNTTGEVFN